MIHFSGSKLALFIGKELLIYLRDDRDGLLYSGMWDLPGGGREADETPEECVLRELREEFDIDLTESQLSYKSHQLNKRGNRIYFFVAHCSEELAAQIRFGGEGQLFRLAAVNYFLNANNAIPHLQEQSKKYFDHQVN